MSTSPRVTSAEQLVALAAGNRAGEQADSHAALGQHLAQRAEMLAGEDLGRRHQRRLISVSHGQQHRVDGHHRLAAADVAVQEAVHRGRAIHVGGDLANRLILPGGQLPGEQPANAGVDSRRCFEQRSIAAGQLPVPLHRQRELQNEQLLIDESPLGLQEPRGVVRKMNLAKRLFQRPDVLRREIRFGKNLVEQIGVAIDRRTNDSSAGCPAAALR